LGTRQTHESKGFDLKTGASVSTWTLNELEFTSERAYIFAEFG